MHTEAPTEVQQGGGSQLVKKILIIFMFQAIWRCLEATFFSSKLLILVELLTPPPTWKIPPNLFIFLMKASLFSDIYLLSGNQFMVNYPPYH